MHSKRRSRRSRKSMARRRSHRKSLGMRKTKIHRMLKHISRSRPQLRKHLKRIMSRAGEGRGSGTRGWSGAKPNTTSERRIMMQRCGAKCFLLPSQLKFPICPIRPRISCRPSRQGVLAAKIRARQHKYASVTARADRILKSLK
jgi:hypothetical protein